MPVTSADLWKLLKQSHLISGERLDQVRDAFGQAGSQPDQVPAKALAQWLMQRKMLTSYQAKVLLNGRSGPFNYGDYQIQDRIRSGRFGKSFLALHVPSRFGVQLKFASSRIAQDPRQWNTARQYIHTVSPIVHDQLQRVFALEDEAGYRYLVLERLTGTSLTEELSENGRLPVSTACRIIRLAALGLAALHENRLVHGDVRPENLWLDSRNNVKLLRDNLHPPIVPALWQPGLTAAHVAQADYMAPELAHPGTLLSPITDVYALGCTLYQLLEGNAPYAGGDAADKLRRHAADAIRPIQAQPVPAALTNLILDLLAKEPSARIADASDVAEKLLPFIDSSMQSVPELTQSATFLAFQEALQHPTTTTPPAPPPVVPEADDHPTLTAPPVQAISPPPQVTQEMAPEATPPEAVQDVPPDAANTEEIDADVPPADTITVVAQPRRSRPIDRLRRKRRSRRKQAITLSVLAIALLLMAISFVALNPQLRESLFGKRQVVAVKQPSDSLPSQPKKVVAEPGERSPAKNTRRLSRYEIRDDDGSSLWMTPTTGSPIPLQYVAPGAQLLLVARPHDIVTADNGKQVLRAMGPQVESGRQALEKAAGYTLDQIAELIVCLHPTESSFDTSMIVRLQETQPLDQLLAAWGNPKPEEYHDQKYYVARDWVFFVPEQESVTQFVMGSEPLIQEVIDTPDAPPILRRELARLLQDSDSDRHLSLLFAPDFLAEDLLQDNKLPVTSHPLRETITWLLNDDVKGCLVSMQFEDLFFVELRAYGQVDLDGPAVADTLRDRIGEIPDRIESVFEQVYPSVYWRRVALRFPEMIRFLHRYSRVGVEDGQAIVNAVLPAQAAHNLVFGAEMLLGMQTSTKPADEAVRKPVSTPSVPKTIEELTQRSMDLSFAQKSLEFAIEDLTSDVREAYPRLPFDFEIRILGSDLQLDGITRNQQISEFTADNKTIGEILTAIVMRANPDQTISAPSEADQKLVWVVGPNPADPKKQILLITTRDAAQRKGYKLPGPFQPK